MGEKQREIVGQVLPAYRKLAAAGQIEISTTPYYHPILPLLCDSNIASVSHPNVPLPRALPLSRRRPHANWPWRANIAGRRSAAQPVGLWPSEGSVSDEVFAIAAELGFEWAATDSGVLNRTVGQAVPVDGLYRPYQWRQGGRTMSVIFRDHFMSDLIGFVYSKMDAGRGGGRFSAAHPRELRRHPRRGPRRAGPHHSGWRERLGILRPQRPAVPARVVPADFRRRPHERRHGERGPAADGAATARPHFPRLVDRRQFRRVDRRRGRQPGLDATAARAADLRCRHRGVPKSSDAWPWRNC